MLENDSGLWAVCRGSLLHVGLPPIPEPVAGPEGAQEAPPPPTILDRLSLITGTLLCFSFPEKKPTPATQQQEEKETDEKKEES